LPCGQLQSALCPRSARCEALAGSPRGGSGPAQSVAGQPWQAVRAPAIQLAALSLSGALPCVALPRVCPCVPVCLLLRSTSSPGSPHNLTGTENNILRRFFGVHKILNILICKFFRVLDFSLSSLFQFTRSLLFFCGRCCLGRATTCPFSLFSLFFARGRVGGRATVRGFRRTWAPLQTPHKSEARHLPWRPKPAPAVRSGAQPLPVFVFNGSKRDGDDVRAAHAKQRSPCLPSLRASPPA
jgi:hypothetical protein